MTQWKHKISLVKNLTQRIRMAALKFATLLSISILGYMFNPCMNITVIQCHQVTGLDLYSFSCNLHFDKKYEQVIMNLGIVLFTFSFFAFYCKCWLKFNDMSREFRIFSSN